MDPSLVPWFAEASPGLLTNKTIRAFLSQYSQQQWPLIVKLIVLHGILSVQHQYPGVCLSAAQLKELVEKGACSIAVERNIPQLQRQILNLQQELDAVFDRLGVAVQAQQQPVPLQFAPVQPSGAAKSSHRRVARSCSQPQIASPTAGSGKPETSGSIPAAPSDPALHMLTPPSPVPRAAAAVQAKPCPVRQRSTSPVVAPKPPDEWRTGEPSGFPSPNSRKTSPLRRSEGNQGATNPIYPDWWGDPGPPLPPPPKQQQPHKKRPPPRLAYTWQPSQNQATPFADDLATAEYLVVPSTGASLRNPPAVVPGAGPHPTALTITPDTTAWGDGQQWGAGQLQDEAAGLGQQQHVHRQGQAPMLTPAAGAAGGWGPSSAGHEDYSKWPAPTAAAAYSSSAAAAAGHGGDSGSGKGREGAAAMQRLPSAPPVAAPEEGGGGSLRARARSGAAPRRGQGTAAAAAAAGDGGWGQYGHLVGGFMQQSRSPGQSQSTTRLARLARVESRIKADVQASKQKAAAHRAAQRQLFKAALLSSSNNNTAVAGAWGGGGLLADSAEGLGAKQETEQDAGAVGAAGNGRGIGALVVSIADNFLANPLSAWFLGESSSGPTCQPGVTEYRQVVEVRGGAEGAEVDLPELEQSISDGEEQQQQGWDAVSSAAAGLSWMGASAPEITPAAAADSNVGFIEHMHEHWAAAARSPFADITSLTNKQSISNGGGKGMLEADGNSMESRKGAVAGLSKDAAAGYCNNGGGGGGGRAADMKPPRPGGWMCDYGHLQNADWLEEQGQQAKGRRTPTEHQGAGTGFREQPASDRGQANAGGKASGWVGDFGKLEGPRFDPAMAFKLNRFGWVEDQTGGAYERGDPAFSAAAGALGNIGLLGTSGLFMSPSQLQQLVTGARNARGASFQREPEDHHHHQQQHMRQPLLAEARAAARAASDVQRQVEAEAEGLLAGEAAAAKAAAAAAEELVHLTSQTDAPDIYPDSSTSLIAALGAPGALQRLNQQGSVSAAGQRPGTSVQRRDAPGADIASGALGGDALWSGDGLLSAPSGSTRPAATAMAIDSGISVLKRAAKEAGPGRGVAGSARAMVGTSTGSRPGSPGQVREEHLEEVQSRLDYLLAQLQQQPPLMTGLKQDQPQEGAAHQQQVWPRKSHQRDAGAAATADSSFSGDAAGVPSIGSWLLASSLATATTNSPASSRSSSGVGDSGQQGLGGAHGPVDATIQHMQQLQQMADALQAALGEHNAAAISAAAAVAASDVDTPGDTSVNGGAASGAYAGEVSASSDLHLLSAGARRAGDARGGASTSSTSSSSTSSSSRACSSTTGGGAAIWGDNRGVDLRAWAGLDLLGSESGRVGVDGRGNGAEAAGFGGGNAWGGGSAGALTEDFISASSASEA